MLRFMGLVAPTGGGTIARVRGIAIMVGLVIALLLIATGIAELIGLPFGGLSLLTAVWVGILILVVALVVLIVLGRRRQGRAKAARAAGPGK
jgi:hypothetical protein